MGKLFSPGKLLLTSEYVVLDGALALAIPTKPGQEFFFEEYKDGKSEITWEANHQGRPWLKAKISYKNWALIETNLPEAAEFVLNTLKNVQKLSQLKFQSTDSYSLVTDLQFPANFGLGSSSTLMNNLAEWAEIDAFDLNKISLGGSGYDIAVAKTRKPLLYRLTETGSEISPINFEPSFKDHLIFIHLNQKQDSREGIRLYRSKEKSAKLIGDFTEITKAVANIESLTDFSGLMQLHEQKMSAFLKLPTAKEIHFEDCPVFIKSLGAWGGDFVMSSKFNGFQDYFLGKGFSTVFSWKDIIN